MRMASNSSLTSNQNAASSLKEQLKRGVDGKPADVTSDSPQSHYQRCREHAGLDTTALYIRVYRTRQNSRWLKFRQWLMLFTVTKISSNFNFVNHSRNPPGSSGWIDRYIHVYIER